MILLDKLKEAATSVIPVMILVWLLHLIIAPLSEDLVKFMVGGVFLITGLAIFLLGAEIGIVPMGQRAGSALTHKRNLALLLCAGFITGFFITVAEPDVHVLGQQVAAVNPALSQMALVLLIAAGVGMFVALALLRIVMQISLRLVLLIGYALVFICAIFVPPTFLGIAFDAGGATTGPMTVPFIMALGIGVAAVRSGSAQADSFGLIGIASIGPILSVIFLGVFQSGEQGAGAEAYGSVANSVWGHFWGLAPEIAAEVALALTPLVFLFIIFRLFFVRLTPYRMLRVIMGLIYAWLGLVFFFMGAKGGFIPAGASLGQLLALHPAAWVLPSVAFVLGALTVFAEPAVWVLTTQVEEVSGGAIKKQVLLAFMCIGVACAVAMALGRVTLGIPLWIILVPGYAVSFLLTLRCPQLFTAIAFDSGGVASGPMASTFILSFTLGAAGAVGNPADAFGAIALIAMTPLIAIQLLGMLYSHKITTVRKKSQ